MPKARLKSETVNPSEDDIQIALMEWVNLQPQLRPFIFHIPNQGKRTGRYGLKLKKMGMRPGVFDIFVAIANHGYHGMFLELKSKNGRLSSEQLFFMKDMQKQGYFMYGVNNLDAAIDIIQAYTSVSLAQPIASPCVRV